jgi:phosphoribosylformimino-5-aminoimidazole carboxamide ribonucleotide (ProFAR) isomerase
MCYRYDMKEHWSHTYLTAKHLVDLYQASIKEKRERNLNEFCLS